MKRKLSISLDLYSKLDMGLYGVDVLVASIVYLTLLKLGGLEKIVKALSSTSFMTMLAKFTDVGEAITVPRIHL